MGLSMALDLPVEDIYAAIAGTLDEAHERDRVLPGHPPHQIVDADPVPGDQWVWQVVVDEKDTHVDLGLIRSGKRIRWGNGDRQQITRSERAASAE